MFKYRLKAFAAHLSASLVIVLISAVLVFFVWYPAPLYKATGVNRIFLIVLGIGLVVGPLLTFLVSKPNKNSLKFDIVVIIVLQLAGFFYGLYQIYDGRPAWIAYNVDRFDLVKNNEIDMRKLVQASPEYQETSISGPRYVAAVIPKNNPELSNEILFDEVGSGIAPSQRPELYLPLINVNRSINERIISLSELEKYNNKTEVREILSAYPEADSFLPLKASIVNMVVLMSTDEQPKVIEIVDLRPW